VLASWRKAATPNRAIQGVSDITRCSGMSSGPSNANSCRQKLNSNCFEGSVSTCSVAMWPTLPNEAPAVAGSARSSSSTGRPWEASLRAMAQPITPAPMTAMVGSAAAEDGFVMQMGSNRPQGRGLGLSVYSHTVYDLPSTLNASSVPP
jgi:hypothetical protein